VAPPLWTGGIVLAAACKAGSGRSRAVVFWPKRPPGRYSYFYLACLATSAHPPAVRARPI